VNKRLLVSALASVAVLGLGSFWTLSSTGAESPPVIIVAAGDICPQAGPDRCQVTADLITAIDPTAVLTLGDNQYQSGTLAEYKASYDQAWGAFKNITRPTPGNHEWYSGASGYLQYFGATASPQGSTYYSYDLGNWHLIALDSSCGKVGGCRPGSPQYSFLQNDLAANTSSCVLAYWHHPLFTSGAGHAGMQAVRPLWDLLWADRAELILNGHAHNYERFAAQRPDGTSPGGIRQFIVGTGGASYHGFNEIPAPNSRKRLTGVPGVLRLALSASSYQWEFLTPDGRRDAGTGMCR
jgi:acid phosphatase type 7